MEPEVAILHIGFDTQPGDPKQVYAEGARTSNAIIDALKQAGVQQSDIRSESQYLNRDYTLPKSHKFKLSQQWTVRTTPERAAEILDIAVTAGANTSGEIEWTVKDEKALEEQALDRAAGRAKENAAVLAKGMGVRLGIAGLRQQPALVAGISKTDADGDGDGQKRRPGATARHRAAQGHTRGQCLRGLCDRVVAYRVFNTQRLRRIGRRCHIKPDRPTSRRDNSHESSEIPSATATHPASLIGCTIEVGR